MKKSDVEYAGLEFALRTLRSQIFTYGNAKYATRSRRGLSDDNFRMAVDYYWARTSTFHRAIYRGGSNYTHRSRIINNDTCLGTPGARTSDYTIDRSDAVAWRKSIRSSVSRETTAKGAFGRCITRTFIENNETKWRRQMKKEKRSKKSNIQAGPRSSERDTHTFLRGVI